MFPFDAELASSHPWSIRFFYHFFTTGLGIEVLELHSRMSQASRSRTRDEFKAKKASILFTSDVSARGVDYPNVSLVIQVSRASIRYYSLSMAFCN